MAIENKYVNPDVAIGKLAIPGFQNVASAYQTVSVFQVLAADDDGSIYRLGTFNPEMVVTKIEILNDAITGGTSYDLGFYKSLEDKGAVLLKDALLAGADLSSGHGQFAPLNGLSNVAIEDSQKRLWELAGLTKEEKVSNIDIAFTANTVGTADGDIIAKMTFIGT